MPDMSQSKFACREERCGKCHHTLIHRPKVTPNGQWETEGNIHSQCSNRNKFALLQFITVILKSGNAELNTNAFLDTGSDVGLNSTAVASKLNLKGSSSNLKISSAPTKTSGIHWTSVNLNVSSISQTFEKGNLEA